MRTWNLEPLFSGYGSEEFKHAIASIEQLVEETETFKQALADAKHPADTIREYLDIARRRRELFIRAYGFVNLTLATDAEDEESHKWMNRLQQLSSEMTTFDTAFKRWLGDLDDLDRLLEEEEVLQEFQELLKRMQKDAAYLLSDREEALVAKLAQTGSSAWSRLQGLLTSTLEVPFEGETLTLSEIRNKAHSKEADTRKKAYEAEIDAYPKVEKSVAAALNSIKGEVNELTELRGYESPLQEAIHNSRMRQETLDVLIEAMREARPMFWRYLKRKAELLGHEGGLPWYDLFAPLGSAEREFTVDEAMDYVVDNFASFSEDLSALAKRAHQERWIDFTPRKGKRGGAFCFNIHPLGESRILTNFKGSFSDVITLAHELGHAYHGEQVFKEDILNASYTMPVAETASTFCETIVKRAAIEEAESEEKLFLLEQSLMGSTQVVVDILSRFLFEKNVFEARKETPLSAERLKTFMREAQQEAYGEGVDAGTLHPYMWVNKPHYYSGGLSFYNFPYAFGLLFAKGIYAMYQKQGDAFIPEIRRLLQETGKKDVEDLAAMVGADVTDKRFWEDSLAVIKDEIDTFLELTEARR